MANGPKTDYEKIQKIVAAWTNLRPTKIFANMTSEQFIARALTPSTTVRTKISRLENELTAAHSERDIADATGLKVALRVVNAVKSDEEEGEDGELYETMGYVRKSERKSGLSRRANAARTTTKA
ncbi:MAG: hypothetical protein QM790_04645 [Nibricoccus sp.]